jgi:putative sterol carrier protein
MPKFLSDEYFKELERVLANDTRWNETTKGVKTSILIGASDLGQNYILSIDNGVTKLEKTEPGAQPEFSFDGTYETWKKVAKGDFDLQTAVLKGQLRFKGSFTKVLYYKERFVRISELLKTSQTEF